jgi:hypothetical protein
MPERSVPDGFRIDRRSERLPVARLSEHPGVCTTLCRTLATIAVAVSFGRAHLTWRSTRSDHITPGVPPARVPDPPLRKQTLGCAARGSRCLALVAVVGGPVVGAGPGLGGVLLAQPEWTVVAGHAHMLAAVTLARATVAHAIALDPVPVVTWTAIVGGGGVVHLAGALGGAAASARRFLPGTMDQACR